LEVLEDRTVLSTLTVLNASDHDPGSLRATIAAASNGDLIVFDPALDGQTITLTTGELLLDKDLSITGPGAGLLAVSGNNFSRVFEVASNTTVSISGLTIRNGRSVTFGGGIYNAGTLMLTSATVSDNVTVGYEPDFGGGIYNRGTSTIQNSTITHNTAEGVNSGTEVGFGGGIYNVPTVAFPFVIEGGIVTVSNSIISDNQANHGGGIFNALGELPTAGATVTISNSSIAGNDASSDGGGIDNSWDNPAGRNILTVSNSTISGNTTESASSGGYGGAGISNQGILNMRNTILAGNSDTGGVPDLSGSLASSGYNLIGNTEGADGFADTDLLNVAPLLGPLQDNGGGTQTMALLPGSPALNAGDPAQLGVADQRAVVRSGGVNIGAFQASASALVLTAPDTVTAGMPFDLTVTAVDAFGQVAVGYTGTVTFSTTDPDPGVVLPADYTFTPADGGSHPFSAGCTLITPGQQTLTVSDPDGGRSASLTLPVNP
jgi:hypothetical protein